MIEPTNSQLLSHIRWELAALRPETYGPPPSDIEAERRIVACVLFGDTCPAWFNPDDCTTFARGVVVVGKILRAAGKFPSPLDNPTEAFLPELYSLGWGGLVHQELQDAMRDYRTACLDSACAVVAGLAERRRLLEVHETICAKLRCKEIPMDEIFSSPIEHRRTE